MSTVRKIKIEGYNAFFEYSRHGIKVYVNHQSQFEAGQKDAYIDFVISELHAKEARNMIVENVTYPIGTADMFNEHLQKNGFNLEKE